MPLSDKIKDTRFSKSVAGYAIKEVDGFVEEILPAVADYEKQLSALRVKLDAYESRADEIAKRESDAERLLCAAREESAKILRAAELEGKGIAAEAEAKASEITADAEARAAMLLSEAKKKAEAIIAAADAKGKETVAAASSAADKISCEAAAVRDECAAFEKHFREIVADTVKNLAAIRTEAPRVKAAQKPKKAEKKEPAEKQPENEPDVTRDYEFAGGKRVAAPEEKKTQRRLYDTVTVVYDSEDDFADVKKLKEALGKKEIKNPTDF